MSSNLSTSSTSVRKRGPPRCLFAFSDGRRCRMLRAPDHSALCFHHSREERQILESERIGALLAATPSGEYLTASDVNPVLGKLFAAIAQNRIPARNASLLAYVGQLLLHSVGLAKDEIINTRGPNTWRRLVDTSLRSPTPLPPPTSSALQPASDSSPAEPLSTHPPDQLSK